MNPLLPLAIIGTGFIFYLAAIAYYAVYLWCIEPTLKQWGLA